MLTAERLRELLDYDAESGELRWRRWKNGVRRGRAAGCYCKRRNCIIIGIEKRIYLAHRLAWLWVHGSWPAEQIDHINGNSADNRLINLRDVPRSVNMQNRRKPAKHNRSGVLGVRQRENGRWSAELRVNRRSIHLGRFNTKQDAYAAYLEAKRRLHAGCTI